MDGFRFDLMGLIDTTTMKQLTAELHTEVSPSILLYGEPWGAMESPLGDDMTLKGAQPGAGFTVLTTFSVKRLKGTAMGRAPDSLQTQTVRKKRCGQCTGSHPSGIWNVVVDQGQAGTQTLRTVKGGEVRVPGISMTVMYSSE